VRANSRKAVDPERTCILSGGKAVPAQMLRLAIGPDDSVAPDFTGSFPGRGAWISLDRSALETALAKGKLRAALLRSFKGAKLTIPADLPERVAQGLEKRVLDRLGLTMKAGALVTGSDAIATLLNKGKAWLVLHASDAAPDGIRKLGGSESMILPVGRDALSLALGKGNVVHFCITERAAADRLLIDIQRWLAYGVPGQAADSQIIEQA
jgi:uncharacterized protein